MKQEKIFLIVFSDEAKVYDGLLSFSEHRSIYEFGFVGRYKLLDFPLSIALNIGSRDIFILGDEKENSLKESLLISNQKILSLFNIYFLSKDSDGLIKLTEYLTNYDGSYCVIIRGGFPIIGNFYRFIQHLYSDFKNILLKFSFRNEAHTQIIFSESSSFVYVLNRILSSDIKTKNIYESIINGFIVNGAKEVIDYGYMRYLYSITAYYKANMEFIYKFPFFYNLLKRYKLYDFFGKKGEGKIGKNAKVKNSIISDNCLINGEVINSIIFPNVIIEKGCVIKDSIILDNNHIGKNCRIFNTIIDEGEEGEIINIGESSSIGREGSLYKNKLYPEYIYSGLTVISRGNIIGKKSHIGAGCYIKSSESKRFLSTVKLKDGESI